MLLIMPMVKAASSIHYVKRRLSDGTDYLCLDMAKTEKRAALSVISNSDEIALACARVHKNKRAFNLFGAVYVVGLPGVDICKIGYSNSPLHRLSALQTGLWDDIIIHGVFWGAELVAKRLEAQALKLANSHGLRLKGEWVALPPDEAIGLCLSTLDGSEAVTDSRTFNENWAPHNEALYAKGGKMAIEAARQSEIDRIRSGEPYDYETRQKVWMYEST